jgi:hypothetical protein
MTTNNAVNTTLSGQTGTGTFVGATSPTLVTPVLGAASATSVKLTAASNVFIDSNNNNMVAFNPVASSVNYMQFTNNSTGGGPAIAAVGSDSNITLAFVGKGNGGTLSQGLANGNQPAAGYKGEQISSLIVNASAVSLSTTVAKDVTSISLTAGVWEITANIFYNISVGATSIRGWTNTSSATDVDNSLAAQIAATTATVATSGMTMPVTTIASASSSTVYLSAKAVFAAGTVTACGLLLAVRIG